MAEQPARLDRAKAEEVIDYIGDGYYAPWGPTLDQLEACILPDPRIAQMEAVVAELQRDPNATLTDGLGAIVDVLTGAGDR